MIYYLFLLFMFLEYVRPGSYVPALNALHLNSIVPLMVILGTAVAKGAVSNRYILEQFNTKVFGALLGLIMIGFVTADVTMYAVDVWKIVLGYTLLYWMVVRNINDLKRIKGLFLLLVIVHVLLAAATPQMFTDPEGRYALAAGTFLGDGNDFALSVNITIPFCLFLMSDAKTKSARMFYGGALVFLVLCVVATKSRGGTLALAAVAVYYWFKSDRKMLYGVAGAAIAVMVLAVASPQYIERMQTISSHEDGSSQGRLEAWGAATQMAMDNPLFGVGAGMFPAKFGTVYRSRDSAAGGRWKTAHSIYFLILGEMGVPGLSVLLALIISNIRQNKRLVKELAPEADGRLTPSLRLLNCLSASMIGFAVAGAFLSAAYYPHIFVLSGLMVAARRIVRERMLPPQETTRAPSKVSLSSHPAMRRPVIARRAS